MNVRNYSTRNAPNVQVVKQAIAGREYEILQDVAGILDEFLTGRHCSCPICGGKNRFRWMIEREGKPVFCNQCFKKKNGDIIAAVMWMRKCSFQEALQLIAQYLGLSLTTGDKLPIPGREHVVANTAIESQYSERQGKANAKNKTDDSVRVP